MHGASGWLTALCHVAACHAALAPTTRAAAIPASLALAQLANCLADAVLGTVGHLNRGVQRQHGANVVQCRAVAFQGLQGQAAPQQRLDVPRLCRGASERASTSSSA